MLNSASYEILKQVEAGLDERLDAVETHMSDLDYHTHVIADNRFSPMTVGHLRVMNYLHNYFAEGTVGSSFTLNTNTRYYFLTQGRCAALSKYQGDPTVNTLWFMAANGDLLSMPLFASNEGVWFTVPNNLNNLKVVSGDCFKFTLTLVLF